MKHKIELKQNTENLFFLEKYAWVYLFIYSLLIPYFLGLIFVFSYISNFDVSLFLHVVSRNNLNFFFNWIIGYEIVSSLVFLYIVFSYKKLFK